MTNVVTVVSEPVNFFTSKGMNRRQFKDFLGYVQFEHRDALCYAEP
jgi:hypothetical protein